MRCDGSWEGNCGHKISGPSRPLTLSHAHTLLFSLSSFRVSGVACHDLGLYGEAINIV